MGDQAAPASSGKLAALVAWIDARFPLTKLWKEHLSEYYTPKNFNFWYYFGGIALFILGLQILTGIFLTMSYKPSAAEAFGSVEYIMRDVEWGWLIRYMHSTGASGFFVVIYLHMFRALLYGSHHKPRELVWIFGVLIYLALMAEAFFGYLLPWGNMSYWGAQVIVFAVRHVSADRRFADRMDPGRLFHLGHHLEPLLRAARGCFATGADLVSSLCISCALHEVGSNNPDGIEIKKTIGPEADPARTGYRFIPTSRSRTCSDSAFFYCCSPP